MKDLFSLRSLLVSVSLAVFSFGGFFPGSVNADTIYGPLYISRNTVIYNDVIKGDVHIHDANFTLKGHGAHVEGDIYQYGRGSVIIDGGLVKGSIIETGRGSIIIKNSGYVERGGIIAEYGRGVIKIIKNAKVRVLKSKIFGGPIIKNSGGQILQ